MGGATLRSGQAALFLWALGLYAVPFALALAMRGWRSLAVFCVVCAALIVYLAWPFIAAPYREGPSGPYCGVGMMALLFVDTLLGAGFLAGAAGRAWMLSSKGAQWRRRGAPVIGLGLACLAGVGWFLRPFLS